MIADAGLLAVALAGGVLVGLVFFGGLALTLNRWTGGAGGAALLAVSLLVRIALAAAALAVLVRLHPLAPLTALAGVLVARTVLIRAFGPRRQPVER